MHVIFNRVIMAMMALGLASCASGSSRGATAGPNGARPVAISTMSAHGSVHLALTAPQVQSAFDKADCRLVSPYDTNGGLRITATSSGSPGSSIVIVGSSVARDGDVTWTADGTRARIAATNQINASLPEGVVFTGSTGGTTTLHVEDGGRRGTATFKGATYVSHTTVTDAAGTISWTCS